MDDSLNEYAKRILDGIILIAKYDPQADFSAEHDVIYFGTYETYEEMTPEERAKMEAWGWHESYESWAHFV